jgi:outer membrane immunogenic protein
MKPTSSTLKALIATCAVLLTYLPVSAADLYPPPSPQAPVAAPVPYYNWTGFYVGVNGGWAWGSQDPWNIITNRFDHFSTDISGGVVGGTIGAQIQASHVVMGLEADLDWANIRGSTLGFPTIGGVPCTGCVPINAETKIDWESTLRFRVGYANDAWLFYGTGGLAILGAKTTLTNPTGATACTSIFNGCSGTDRQVGVAVGGGLEYGFTPNLSGKIEYLYMTAASFEVSRHSEVRAGLNYRFGGF